MRQTQLTGNHGQQQHELFSAVLGSHIQRGKISSLESEDEDYVQVSGVIGLGWKMGTISQMRHRLNPINSYGRIASETQRLCFSSNQHCMMKFSLELQQQQPLMKHGDSKE